MIVCLCVVFSVHCALPNRIALSLCSGSDALQLKFFHSIFLLFGENKTLFIPVMHFMLVFRFQFGLYIYVFLLQTTLKSRLFFFEVLVYIFRYDLFFRYVFTTSYQIIYLSDIYTNVEYKIFLLIFFFDTPSSLIQYQLYESAKWSELFSFDRRQKWPFPRFLAWTKFSCRKPTFTSVVYRMKIVLITNDCLSRLALII